MRKYICCEEEEDTEDHKPKTPPGTEENE